MAKDNASFVSELSISLSICYGLLATPTLSLSITYSIYFFFFFNTDLLWSIYCHWRRRLTFEHFFFSVGTAICDSILQKVTV